MLSLSPTVWALHIVTCVAIVTRPVYLGGHEHLLPDFFLYFKGIKIKVKICHLRRVFSVIVTGKAKGNTHYTFLSRFKFRYKYKWTLNVQVLLYSWTYGLKHSGKITDKSARCLEQFKYGRPSLPGCGCTVLPADLWGLGTSKALRLRAADLKLMISEQRMFLFLWSPGCGHLHSHLNRVRTTPAEACSFPLANLR